MTAHLYRLSWFVIGALAATSAHADLLLMKDGDRLTGTLVNITQNTVIFRTTLAGKVFVPVDEVEGVSTDAFVIVALGDEKLLPGRLRHNGGKVYVISETSGEQREVNLADVSSVTSLPASPEAQGPGDRGGQTPSNVSIETGYTLRTGTEDYSGPSLGIEATRPGETAALAGRIEVEYSGDGSRSLDRFFQAEGRATFNPSGIWRPLLALEISRDRNLALEYRADVVAGVAHPVVESSSQALGAEVGLGAALEEFDPGPIRDDQGKSAAFRFRERPQSDTDLNLHLGLRYSRILFHGLTVEEDLMVRPNLSDFGELRARLDSALFVPISPRLRLKLNLQLDYEDPIYRGLDDWRSKFGASIRINF